MSGSAKITSLAEFKNRRTIDDQAKKWVQRPLSRTYDHFIWMTRKPYYYNAAECRALLEAIRKKNHAYYLKLISMKEFQNTVFQYVITYMGYQSVPKNF